MNASAARRIFIGDVHGHYQGLLKLLDLLELTTTDQLYFLGDLIDRGPDSAQVVEFVRQQSYPCLMGNHEQMMLTACYYDKSNAIALQSWLSCGGRETIASYESSAQLNDHLTWVSALPDYLDLGDVWLVHAGVNPHLPIDAQTSQEFCWIRGEFHRIPQPYFSDKVIITGHTITFTFPGVAVGQIAQGAGWLDVDTGAYHPKSGWLTALDYTQRQVYQVNVFDHATRIRPLAEASTAIQPVAAKLGFSLF